MRRMYVLFYRGRGTGGTVLTGPLLFSPHNFHRSFFRRTKTKNNNYKSNYGLLSAVSAQYLGSIGVKVDHGGKCGEGRDVDAHLNLLTWEAMVMATHDVLGEDVTKLISKGKFVSSKETRRLLAEDSETDFANHDVALQLQGHVFDQNERNLQRCEYTYGECRELGFPGFCCFLCGFCSRRLQEATEDEKSREKICELIKDRLPTMDDCLAEATIEC